MAEAKDAAFYREMIRRMVERVDDEKVLRRVWSMLEQARIDG